MADSTQLGNKRFDSDEKTPNLELLTVCRSQLKMALSTNSFKTNIDRAGMDLPIFLKELFDGCQSETSSTITNRREYNQSLVRRGDVAFWFSEEVIDNWEHANHQTKVGRQLVFSDTAVECLLVLRELFRLYNMQETSPSGSSTSTTSVTTQSSLARRSTPGRLSTGSRRSILVYSVAGRGIRKMQRTVGRQHASSQTMMSGEAMP